MCFNCTNILLNVAVFHNLVHLNKSGRIFMIELENVLKEMEPKL